MTQQESFHYDFPNMIQVLDVPGKTHCAQHNTNKDIMHM